MVMAKVFQRYVPSRISQMRPCISGTLTICHGKSCKPPGSPFPPERRPRRSEFLSSILSLVSQLVSEIIMVRSSDRHRSHSVARSSDFTIKSQCCAISRRLPWFQIHLSVPYSRLYCFTALLLSPCVYLRSLFRNGSSIESFEMRFALSHDS